MLKLIKNKILINLFIYSTVFAIGLIMGIANVCGGFLSLSSFDSQEFFVWMYAAINNVVPYKEIFYPYGLFFYFRYTSIFLNYLYILIFPLFFVSLYFILNKVIKARFLSVLSTLVVYIFVLKFSSIGALERYSFFYIIPLTLSYFVVFKNSLNKRFLFVTGLFSGLLTSLFFDQGVYIFLLFFIILITHFFISNKLSFNKFKIEIINYLVVFLGFLIGLFPLLYFIFKHNALSSIIDYLKYLSVITIFAKTPFFVFFLTPNNLLIFGLIIIASTYLLLRVKYFKKQLEISDYFILTLLLEILILEFKSVIRSIDVQILIPSFLLALIFIYKGLFNGVKANYKTQFLMYLALVFVLIFGLDIGLQNNMVKYGLNLKLTNPVTCFLSNERYYKENNQYKNVVSTIKKLDPNPKIYSFPQDPIFYILFNQKPPFYNTIYETSSYNTQETIEKYIKTNNINFVILNSNIISTQDGVPDYIRGNFLLSYTLNNYSFIKNINGFLILGKNKQAGNFYEYRNNYFRDLLNINLENIPASEGKYKFKYLDGTKPLIFGDSNKVNKYIENANISSENLLLVLKNSTNKSQYQIINIQTSENVNTSIKFKDCGQNKTCIINLSRIPLFFKARSIKSINFNNLNMYIYRPETEVLSKFW